MDRRQSRSANFHGRVSAPNGSARRAEPFNHAIHRSAPFTPLQIARERRRHQLSPPLQQSLVWSSWFLKFQMAPSKSRIAH
jgi:hypothetical protein